MKITKNLTFNSSNCSSEISLILLQINTKTTNCFSRTEICLLWPRMKTKKGWFHFNPFIYVLPKGLSGIAQQVNKRAKEDFEVNTMHLSLHEPYVIPFKFLHFASTDLFEATDYIWRNNTTTIKCVTLKTILFSWLCQIEIIFPSEYLGAVISLCLLHVMNVSKTACVWWERITFLVITKRLEYILKTFIVTLWMSQRHP